MTTKKTEDRKVFSQTKKVPKGTTIEVKELLKRLKNIPPLIDTENQKNDE